MERDAKAFVSSGNENIAKCLSSEDSYQKNACSENPTVPTEIHSKTNDNDDSSSASTKMYFKYMELEISLFLVTFSTILPLVSLTTMMLDKVCLAHLQYPAEICNDLSNYTQIKLSAEKITGNYHQGYILINLIPKVVMSLLIGPWSDQFGRKLPLLLNLVLTGLEYVALALCAFYINSRIEYMFIPAFIYGFSGGMLCFSAIVNCYVADIFSITNRTNKYALIVVFSGLGGAVSVAVGGYAYKWLGYPFVFLLSLGGIVLCALLVWFRFPETRGLGRTDSWKTKLKSFFSFKSFIEIFIVSTKERPLKGRRQIFLIIISMGVFCITSNSTDSVSYLFVYHQFNWGNAYFSTIVSIYSLLSFLLLMAMVPLLRRFNISDPCIGIIGTVSVIIKMICIGLSYVTIVYHLANVAGLLFGCFAVASQARLSKIVDKDDLGTIFTFLATIETSFPVLGSILMTQLYNAFLEIFPGTPFLFIASSMIIPLATFIWMRALPLPQYNEIAGKNEEKVPN